MWPLATTQAATFQLWGNSTVEDAFGKKVQVNGLVRETVETKNRA